MTFGTFGLVLGFGAFSTVALSVGECAGGVGAGRVDLLVCAGLDGGDLRGGVAVQLPEPGGCRLGCLPGLLRLILGGGGVVTGGGERLGEGGGFPAGFGGLRLGGDDGGFGATVGGVGDLGATLAGSSA